MGSSDVRSWNAMICKKKKGKIIAKWDEFEFRCKYLQDFCNFPFCSAFQSNLFILRDGPGAGHSPPEVGHRLQGEGHLQGHHGPRVHAEDVKHLGAWWLHVLLITEESWVWWDLKISSLKCTLTLLKATEKLFKLMQKLRSSGLEWMSCVELRCRRKTDRGSSNQLIREPDGNHATSPSFMLRNPLWK